MVSADEVKDQLDRVGFKVSGWGRGEVKELEHILVPGEEIYEAVNGLYEGGFALLVATDIRVLLIDRKPLNYLTVEDLRFDMINEIDYSHRLMGARISIATGNKNLAFRSYNQPRLRKLINHVQHCMAEAKQRQSTHQEGQNQHLGEIKEQLQIYLAAQQQYQQQLHQIEMARQMGQKAPPEPKPVRPPNKLSDYLFAQSLLQQHQAKVANVEQPKPPRSPIPGSQSLLDDIYADGVREVFGNYQAAHPAGQTDNTKALDVNPLKVAYAKLPMVLRNRKFGLPMPSTSIV